jgi:hypothetical protein
VGRPPATRPGTQAGSPTCAAVLHRVWPRAANYDGRWYEGVEVGGAHARRFQQLTVFGGERSWEDVKESLWGGAQRVGADAKGARGAGEGRGDGS